MPHNILDTDAEIRALLKSVRNVAVLGIKTEAQQGQPAYYVPQALQATGLRIIPVPVYYPDATEILGEPVYRTLAEIPEELDLVNIFRRPADIPSHVDDILKKRPRAVWMQSGIHHAEVARTLAEAGIFVVQDRCLMVEYQRLAK